MFCFLFFFLLRVLRMAGQQGTQKLIADRFGACVGMKQNQRGPDLLRSLVLSLLLLVYIVDGFYMFVCGFSACLDTKFCVISLCVVAMAAY